ncbi:hypothetical protein HDU67_002017 [Dinochytrium kinnereticum]|nr:hypothetical protein HDU67_002017 [Dinochytrium kinnereticum]
MAYYGNSSHHYNDSNNSSYNQQQQHGYDYGNQYDNPRSPGGSHQQQQQQYQNGYDNQGYDNSYDNYPQQPQHAASYNAPQSNAYDYGNYGSQQQQGYDSRGQAASEVKTPQDGLPRYNNAELKAPATQWDDKKSDAGPFAASFDGGFVEEKRRRCYPHKPCHWIVLAVVGVAVLTFGLLGYFFWPALPEIKVNYINEFSGLSSSAFTFKIPEQYNKNLNKMEITLNLKMNLSVYNKNLYDLKVEMVDLKAYLNINETRIKGGQKPKDLDKLTLFVGPPPVGRDPKYIPSLNPLLGVGNKTSLVFPARKNMTFEMDFILSYTPDPQLGLVEDPTFMEFCDVCGITNDVVQERPAQVSYHAISTVSFLKSFGYKPDISGNIMIKCPIRGDYLENLFNYASANPNATATDIIQNVFNTTVSA